MNRYTTRNNSFNPHGRYGRGASMGHQKPPRNLRAVIRSGFDFLHDHLFISLIILALCMTAAWYLLTQHHAATRQISSSSSDSSNAPVLEKGTPDYDTVVPKGRTAAGISWTRIAPPDHSPVYTYVDTVGDVTIRVSEQPLPDSLKDNPDSSVQALAANDNATQKLSVGATTIYIGNNAKGPQSVFFYKRSILVIITTDKPLTTDQWMSYVSSLQ